MYKKTSIFLIVFFMLISAFVGCKKGSLPAITTTDNTSAATTEPGSASETPRTDDDAVRDSNALEVEAEPAEKTGASETELKWLSYRLTQEPLRGMEETDRFQVKDPPSGSRYIVARLLSVEGELQTTDITEHATTFLLKDVEGNAYEPCLYSMWGVTFDVTTGVFGTKDTQEGFYLLFVVPESVDLTELRISTE